MVLIVGVSATQEYARRTSFGILNYVIAFANLNYANKAKHGTMTLVNANVSLKLVLKKTATDLSLTRRSANACVPSLKYHAQTKQLS